MAKKTRIEEVKQELERSFPKITFQILLRIRPLKLPCWWHSTLKSRPMQRRPQLRRVLQAMTVVKEEIRLKICPATLPSPVAAKLRLRRRSLALLKPTAKAAISLIAAA